MKSIIKMVSLLAGYKKWVTLSLLLGAATIFANIGLLGTSTWLISRAALQPSIATLQVAIVGVRFFGISRGVLRYAERLISHSVNFRLVASLRKWFFERLEPLVPLALSENKAGDLLSRSVNDINALDTFFIRVISPLLVAIIVAAGMLIFTGSFAGGIIPILLIGYGVGGILVPFFQYSLMKKPTMRLTSERAHLDAALVDYQRGMAEILVNNRVDSWIHDFEKMQEVMNSSQKKLVFWVGAGTTAGLVTSNLTMLAVVYAFISLIASIDFGGILLCVLAVITLASFEAITPLNQTAKYLNANLTAGERLFQISEKNCMISEPLPDTVLPRRYDLEVESLTFSFPGSQETVLSKVGFTLRENHRLAILGPSGAGKTSLAQILMRLWDYQHGSIRLGGEEIKNLPAEFIRNRIGLLTQSPYIFTATIRGNLLLGDLKAKRIDLENVLEQTGLSTWVHGLEEGMDTWLGESGIKISGGEKQRLALARILLHKPAILILDEPTANLDSITAAGLVSAILAIRGCSQIWISHRSLGLETMNEILVLKSGVTIERGKPSELLRSSGWYRNLLDLEQKILPDAGTI